MPIDNPTSGPSLSPTVVPPHELCGCWRREYIKQTFRPPRLTDDPSRGIVRYLQLSTGLCADIRVQLEEDGKTISSSGHDCFVGFATWNKNEKVLSWHAVLSRGPQEESISNNSNNSGAENLKSKSGEDGAESEENAKINQNLQVQLATAAAAASEAPAATEDRGRIDWISKNPDVWLETDVAEGAKALEERWERVPDAGIGAVPGQVKEAFRVYRLKQSREFILRRGGFMVQVLLPPAESSYAPVDFSFGRLVSVEKAAGAPIGKTKWVIETSTDQARVGTEIELVG